MPLKRGQNGSFTYRSELGTLRVEVKTDQHRISFIDSFSEAHKTRETTPSTTIIIEVNSPKPATLIQDYINQHPSERPIAALPSLALLENPEGFKYNILDPTSNPYLDNTGNRLLFYPTDLVPSYKPGKYDRVCFIVNKFLLASQQPTPFPEENILHDRTILSLSPDKELPFLTPLHWAAFRGYTQAANYLAHIHPDWPSLSSNFDVLNDFGNFEPQKLNPVDIACAVHGKNTMPELYRACFQNTIFAKNHVVNGIQQHTPDSQIDSAKTTHLYQKKPSFCTIS